MAKPPFISLNKAHVKGYWRDGVYIREHETKTPAGKVEISYPQPKTPNMSTPKQKVTGAQFGGRKNSKPKSGSLLDKFAPQPSAAKPIFHPDAIVHPERDDDGKPILIKDPDAASPEATWHDPAALATFVPGSAVPAELNGVPFRPWEDHPLTDVSWNFVAGQKTDLDEPPFPEAFSVTGKPKEAAAGAIIMEPDGRIWVIKPTNGFAGYDATFPKGRVEDGMALQASAIKEVFEETGLQIEITGFYGDFERTLTVARYYTAKRVGGTPAAMGWEAQAVQLVPAAQLDDILNTQVDRKIAKLAGTQKTTSPDKKD